MKFIKTELTNQILTITLNDSERNNPLSGRLCNELITVLNNAENDSNIRVIVLTGAGKSFCAGADIEEFTKKLDQPIVSVYEDGNETTAALFKLGLDFKKPIIGAINGYALAGGFGLACLCHLVIASEKARFGITEINIGMFPMVILPVVRKILGERKTLELSLTGEVFGAEKAMELGVVNYVVPEDQLQTEVTSLANKIVNRSPVAIKMGLTALSETYSMDSSKAIGYLNTLRVVNFKSKDLYEGSQAFLEKREPRWIGE